LQSLISCLNSVCLSVRLTHACFVTKPNNADVDGVYALRSADILTPHERAITVSFLTLTLVGGRRPVFLYTISVGDAPFCL